MESKRERFAELREAQEIVKELEEHTDGEIDRALQAVRDELCQAGEKIKYGTYNQHIEKALGQAAGIAIQRNADDIAERATRLMEGEPDQDSE